MYVLLKIGLFGVLVLEHSLEGESTLKVNCGSIIQLVPGYDPRGGGTEP